MSDLSHWIPVYNHSHSEKGAVPDRIGQMSAALSDFPWKGIRGPVGLPPPFFLLAGNSETKEQKKRRKRDGRRTDRVTISVMPQFHALPPPRPLIEQSPSLYDPIAN
jgi:hypothetical protein